MLKTTYNIAFNTTFDHLTIIDGPHRFITTGAGLMGSGDVNPVSVGTIFTFGREAEAESSIFLTDDPNQPFVTADAE